MSLEKNLNEVKDKLTKDQNLLVSAFRLEAFYKKYKFFLFAGIGILLLFGIYKAITIQQENNKKAHINTLMAKLYNTKTNDTEREKIENELSVLNPILYDFYRYVKLQNLNILQLKEKENLSILEQLTHSQHEFIATLASYQYATITENLKMLEDFDDKNSPILADRAKLQAAYVYLQNNNIAKANEILNTIKFNGGNNQVIYQMASLLKHYSLTHTQDNNTIQTNSQK